mgnify:CR=1 FL=1
MRGERHLLTWLVGCLFLALIGLLLVQSSGFSQAPPLIVADSSRDHLLGLRDLDGDGLYLSAEEHPVLLTEFGGDSLSIPTALLSRRDDLLLLDGGSIDQLVSLRDLDGDGLWVSADEITVLYDGSQSIPDWVYPSALCRDPGSDDGPETLYVADRSTTRRRILRLQDLNGNDTFETGEVQVWWSIAQSPGVAAEFLPTELIPLGEADLLVIDGPRGLIHRARDIDGNGLIDTPEEWSPWFTPPGEVELGRITDFQRGEEGRYWIADDLNGQIIVLEDLDADGQIGGEEEVAVFATADSPRSLWPHPAGGVCFGDAVTDTLWHCRDMDGNGSALGPDECLNLLPDSFDDLSIPSVISGPQGWQSLDLESLQPALISRDGEVVEIQGDGWSPGFSVTLQVAGVEIAASSVLPHRIIAGFPPLPEGTHPLWIQSGQYHGYFPEAVFIVPTFLRGDVTRDGHLNLADPLRLLEWLYIPGTAPLPCLDAADVNDDEMLQLIDAVWLLDYLFGGGPMPPSPFPESGPDPIQEEQGCLF